MFGCDVAFEFVECGKQSTIDVDCYLSVDGTKQSGGVETADYELHIVDVGESNPENTAALVGESPRLPTPDKEDDMKVNPPPRRYEK